MKLARVSHMRWRLVVCYLLIVPNGIETDFRKFSMCANKAADTGRKEACSIHRVASQIGKYIRTFVSKKGADLALADQPDFFKES